MDISIISYNSRGFNKCKQDFVKMLPCLNGDAPTIVCNQENFLLKNNDYFVRQTLPNHHIVFKPAVKEGLEGRPMCGMFIAIPMLFKDKIDEVKVNSFRIQSIILSLPSSKLLIINTYFPTDPKSDFDESDLLQLLSDIRRVIEDTDFDNVIWTGDINADFRRNTKFVRIVEDFISELNIRKSWNRFDVDFTHAFSVNEVTYTSTIDHFFWNDNCDALIKEAGTIHLPENMSDHSPIYCKLDMNIDTLKEASANTPSVKFPNWKKATEEQRNLYVNTLDTSLREITLPVHALNCSDPHCKIKSHKQDVDDLMVQVLREIETASNDNQTPGKPKHESGERKSSIPNWKTEIKPLKDDAYFWNSVWISAGKPINCHLHNIMKRTRNRYHLAIRRNKRSIDAIRKNRLLKSCLENDVNIFEEIRRQRKCRQTPTSTIDGQKENIPGYLADKYKTLYNGVDDKENLHEFQVKLNKNICENSCKYSSLFTPEILKQCARKLKSGKTDPIFSITSDYLIHGPPILFELLSFCLQSYINHGHVSDILLISTMVPLVKDKLGDLTSSNNYRSIAISSLIMKIYDIAIITVFQDSLKLDDLQFGYQSEVSTSMCTFIAIETISYFQKNNSDVYTCLMDMSKAFDTVQHSVLFQKLLDQGMPHIIVRFLLISYESQKANVRWMNEKSSFFTLGNGVKQGAVLSAILYCVYTNGLFKELRRKNIGCCIGDHYVGVIGYADDLFLMAPTLDGLQKMLNVCERYAKYHNLKFSTDTNPEKSKTKCVGFLLKERDLPSLKLCGNDLPWVKKGKHLGVKIENTLGKILSQDIVEKRAQYIQRNNELLQEFSYACPRTKTFVNQVYNTSFHGSVLWDLTSKEAEMAYNTWSSSIRRMFGVDRRTHRYFIEPLSGRKHLKTSLNKRFVKFADTISSTKKVATRGVYQMIKYDCTSTVGKNLRSIMLQCKKLHVDQVKTKDVDGLTFKKLLPTDEWKLGFLRELLDQRDLYNSIGWKKKEIQEVIDHICTS